MMYFYATETVEVHRVIDRFANAKKRRLLLLLSRSVGMKLKFDRNIIAIIKLLVFKELPPFESSGYVPGAVNVNMKQPCMGFYVSTRISRSRFEKSGEKSVTNHRFFSRFNDFSSVVKFLKLFSHRKL